MVAGAAVIVKVFVVTPEYGAPLARFTKAPAHPVILTCHWYVIAVPVAVTLKLLFCNNLPMAG